MVRSSASLLASAVLFIPLISTSANSATVFSDGFESPVVIGNGNTGNGYDNYGTGATIGPWTVVGPPGALDAVSVVKGTFTQFGFSFPAQSGQQWADLAGQNSNSTEGVKVTVSGLLGQNYTVSFWIGNLVNPGGPFGTSTTVNLLVNGVQTFAAVNTDGVGQQSLAWHEYTYQSALPSATDSLTFTFLSGDPGSDFNTAFDNVVINTIEATATPLPGAIALFGSALGLFGLVGQRRRRRANRQG